VQTGQPARITAETLRHEEQAMRNTSYSQKTGRFACSLVNFIPSPDGTWLYTAPKG